MGVAEKVKNAATHVKEGAADAVSTVKHGGKNQEGGESKTNTQAAKDTLRDAKDNAKLAGKGHQGPATGNEYENATDGKQTEHPEGATHSSHGDSHTHHTHPTGSGTHVGSAVGTHELHDSKVTPVHGDHMVTAPTHGGSTATHSHGDPKAAPTHGDEKRGLFSATAAPGAEPMNEHGAAGQPAPGIHAPGTNAGHAADAPGTHGAAGPHKMPE